ncbi:MFS transporter [Acholeplasma vituli]|uniref:MFS transporter n=1 Tax=Paracholeplasma vituli TaxID=69473 RepID=A0ABT2PXM9_9MOLU|nr:MFS transporter [Paracholeplasma vituli]MCU0104462.1 MFS transporter [Paracholeplasma vituli]
MKLDYKKTIYVGLAFLIISLFWQTYDAIITKILIDKFGLNQTWSGMVMAMDNVLALFLLPFFGSLSDKTNHKKGKRTPYVVVGTLLAAFLFVGLSFFDAMQLKKLETETNLKAEYENVETYTEDSTVGEWRILALSMGTDSEGTRITNILNDYTLGETLNQGDYNDVKDAYFRYLSNQAWEVTSTSPAVFIVFIVMLFLTLVAMSTFRSPAVALMPDVTTKQLRSKGNALINLMGAFGGITAIILLTVFGLDKHSFVNYTMAFVSVSIIMVVVLAIFLWKVNEPKLVQERIDFEKKNNIVDEEETENHNHLSKEKLVSLILILSSVFLWFMGYNAVTTKLSDYAPKVLNMGYSTPLLIAQATAIVGFIPIGIVSSKWGRRRTILFGVALLTLCFTSVYFITESTGVLLYVVLGLTGVAWASINVNSYPMVVELSKGSDVGKYTGYYYTFSMAAQILTPILSGFLMDMPELGRKVLFPYSAAFVLLSFITMFFVKHGDAKAEKRSILENFDVDMD